MEFVRFIAALVLCYVLGPCVGLLRKRALAKIDLVEPEGISKEDWRSLVSPEDLTEAGKWLGVLERILAFVSFYLGA